MAKILLVEDDAFLRKQLANFLSTERHVVDESEDGEDAVFRLGSYAFDLVILDWNLPGKSGVDVCREYRQNGGMVPVLMLTGRSEADEKIEGLDAGADDYLTKPFAPAELAARVRSLLRRAPVMLAPNLTIGDLELDFQRTAAIKAGEEMELTPREFALLEFFVRHPNEFFSADALLNRLWSSESDASPDVVKVYVNRLRNKLNSVGEPINLRTKYGVGYGLEIKQ